MTDRVRYFEDVEVGEEFSTPGRTITENDAVRFAALAGHHEDLDWSGGEPGQPPPVSDLLVLVVTTGLGFRVPVPQPQVLAFMTFDWERRLPVRVGDTIHCRTRIAAKRKLREGGVLVEQRAMVNQRGEVVQVSEYKLLVARRPEPAAPASARG